MQLRLTSKPVTRAAALAALLCLFLVPTMRAQQTARTDDAHIVSPTQMQQQVQTASAERQKNIGHRIGIVKEIGEDELEAVAYIRGY